MREIYCGNFSSLIPSTWSINRPRFVDENENARILLFNAFISFFLFITNFYLLYFIVIRRIEKKL